MITLPSWLRSTLASDALDGKGVLPTWIRPLSPGRHIAGLASTASLSEGDSLGLRHAIARGAQGGTVLVAFGSPTSVRAIIGDVLGTWMSVQGFQALITDGLARDTENLEAMGLGVWCRGSTPIGSTHVGPGEAGIAVGCGGVAVEPGDLVVADDDGIVVCPADWVNELLRKAEERMRRDAARVQRIRNGLPPD